MHAHDIVLASTAVEVRDRALTMSYNVMLLSRASRARWCAPGSPRVVKASAHPAITRIPGVVILGKLKLKLIKASVTLDTMPGLRTI